MFHIPFVLGNINEYAQLFEKLSNLRFQRFVQLIVDDYSHFSKPERFLLKLDKGSLANIAL